MRFYSSGLLDLVFEAWVGVFDSVVMGSVMFLVVGSGPAGVSCAMALVRAGKSVTMVDGGRTLDEASALLAKRMSIQRKEEWSASDVEAIQGQIQTSTHGVQLKKLFGSDFPYSGVDSIQPTESHRVGHLTASLAVGGFSNVWGAAALQYGNKEFQGWPIGQKEFAAAYREVCRFMPIASERDELDLLYPRCSDGPGPLRRSRQAEGILRGFEQQRERLRRAGIVFGGPRLAVRPHTAEAGRVLDLAGCSYCGQCLFGCPYGHVYSSVQTLQELKAYPSFRHVPGFVVDRFEERGESVTIFGRGVSNGAEASITGSKLFLAAGVVSSARILLAAVPDFGRTVRMRTSEYFMLPLVTFRNFWGGRNDSLHTLSQIFLECVDDKVSPHTVHMQMYTFSEMFRIALDQLGAGGRLLTWPFRSQLLGRLCVIQGYLHSDESSSIDVSLTGDDMRNTLRMVGNPSNQGRRVIRRLMAKLCLVLPRCGLIPLLPMMKIGLPGEGRHAGGAFPMSARPGPCEVDLQCRPSGLRHVHVVDASVFPTIPAATITLTAMANAYRVGQSVASE